MAGPAGLAGSEGPAGPHPRDLGLAEARALVQRAVDKAEQLGLRGAVAVVGATGTLLTASRMDAGEPGLDGSRVSRQDRPLLLPRSCSP